MYEGVMWCERVLVGHAVVIFWGYPVKFDPKVFHFLTEPPVSRQLVGRVNSVRNPIVMKWECELNQLVANSYCNIKKNNAKSVYKSIRIDEPV